MWRKRRAEHPALAWETEGCQPDSEAILTVTRYSDQDLSAPRSVKGLSMSRRGPSRGEGRRGEEKVERAREAR